ncbi:MAG: hypothetical protein V7K88_26740 [Nostoc sp.]|uniref:hypothetical protein n=1 Tax=Nostoc sp. TaxID=1180 RepID=UPI002FFB4019
MMVHYLTRTDGATPNILRFHLQAKLKPRNPLVFVTLTPLRKKERPSKSQLGDGGDRESICRATAHPGKCRTTLYQKPNSAIILITI